MMVIGMVVGMVLAYFWLTPPRSQQKAYAKRCKGCKDCR